MSFGMTAEIAQFPSGVSGCVTTRLLHAIRLMRPDIDWPTDGSDSLVVRASAMIGA